MVFQDYALFPHLSVEANLAFGLSHRPRDERDALTRRTLELVGLQHEAGAPARALGRRAPARRPGPRAGARARAGPPRRAVLEPRRTLRGGLRREVELILRDAGATALLVTHDQEEALSLADRVAVMRDGRIVQVGPPVEVYGEPGRRWAAPFVGEVNVLSGVARGGGSRPSWASSTCAAPASGRCRWRCAPSSWS